MHRIAGPAASSRYSPRMPPARTNPGPPRDGGQLQLLITRWQQSLELHARYAALDDAHYQHVQPWPKHERPARWIIDLARERAASLSRIVEQRAAEGDRAFLEALEVMGFLANLAGLLQNHSIDDSCRDELRLFLLELAVHLAPGDARLRADRDALRSAHPNLLR